MNLASVFARENHEKLKFEAQVEQAEVALTAKEAERRELHRRNGWLRNEIDRLTGATSVKVK